MTAVTPWKGAWGGTWAAAYGGVLLLWGAGMLVAEELLARVLGLAALRIRTGAPEQEVSDLAGRFAALAADLPEALRGGLRWMSWTDVGLAAALVVTGLGALRASDTLRRAALAALGAQVLYSGASWIAYLSVVVPRMATWSGRAREFLDAAEASGHQLGPLGVVLASMGSGGSGEVAIFAIGTAVHLSVVGLLAARLAGPHAKAWCAGKRSLADAAA